MALFTKSDVVLRVSTVVREGISTRSAEGTDILFVTVAELLTLSAPDLLTLTAPEFCELLSVRELLLMIELVLGVCIKDLDEDTADWFLLRSS